MSATHSVRGARSIKRTALLHAGAAALAALIFLPHHAAAHVVCGNRVFPATLTLDDPGVGDELSLPTVQYTPIPEIQGTPSGKNVNYGFEWDKTITQDLGFAINGGYITQYGAGENLTGWNNITATIKDEIPCNEADEFVVSIGVIREFAPTGSDRLASAGVIDSVGNTTPTLYFGKGLGNLPIDYLRPLAVTGTIGYQASDWPNADSNKLPYAFSLQYSMPYLQEHVRALDIPAFLTRLIPLVEVAMVSPTNGPTTGTISPGVLYEADSWQAGIEAMIPANSVTWRAQGVGIIAQLHFFLDDIFPTTIGRPLINRNLWKQ